MLRKSITLKIFILIALGFGIIFIATVLSPLFLFEDFYFDRRLADMKTATLNFSNRYLSDDLDETTLNQAIYDFSEANNAHIDIINLNSLDKSYNFDYQFSVSNYKYGDIELYFNKLTTYTTDFYNAFDLNVGDQVYINGYFINDKTLCPVRINQYTIDKDIYEINNLYFLNIFEVYLIGRVKEIKAPKLEGGELYKSKLFWEQYDTFRKDGFDLIENEIRVYEYTDYETDLVNYGLLMQKDNFLVATIITEQSIGEYIRYMSQYSRFIILGSLIIILSIAIILTRLISKPLIDLNATAVKMANLDFSQKIPVNSKDEIGQLADSLNSMSTVLEVTIDELNNTNAKLKNELLTEKEIESMRRLFIADTSHELKTPLGIVRGYTERIQDKLLSSDMDPSYMINCTGIILDEMRKMDRLILNMNELSKLESVAYTIDKTPIDLVMTISSMVEAFLILIEDKELSIHLSLDQNTPEIMADKYRMEQVLSNFISNAIRYTKEEGHIYIKLTNETDGIRFCIENQCEDLEAIDTDQLWNRFYRVDQSRSRSLGGSGLGLAIVKIILELHGYAYRTYKTDDLIGFEFTIPTDSEHALKAL